MYVYLFLRIPSLIRPLAFACNDKLLLSLTHQSGIAFSNLPRNEIYVPAVSVFMGEQVQMILTSMKVSN